jgi:hypothetical protein
VAEELQKRGYTIYDTDGMADITSFYDVRSGAKLREHPPSPIDFSRYAWRWDVKALKRLLHKNQPVFVVAITANTADNLHLFDKVFVLNPDVETLRHRILARTNNSFGKHPDELARTLKHHEGSDRFWRSKGAIIIDANQPLDGVVEEILGHIPAAEVREQA